MEPEQRWPVRIKLEHIEQGGAAVYAHLQNEVKVKVEHAQVEGPQARIYSNVVFDDDGRPITDDWSTGRVAFSNKWVISAVLGGNWNSNTTAKFGNPLEELGLNARDLCLPYGAHDAPCAPFYTLFPNEVHPQAPVRRGDDGLVDFMDYERINVPIFVRRNGDSDKWELLGGYTMFGEEHMDPTTDLLNPAEEVTIEARALMPEAERRAFQGRAFDAWFNAVTAYKWVYGYYDVEVGNKCELRRVVERVRDYSFRVVRYTHALSPLLLRLRLCHWLLYESPYSLAASSETGEAAFSPADVPTAARCTQRRFNSDCKGWSDEKNKSGTTQLCVEFALPREAEPISLWLPKRVLMARTASFCATESPT